MQPNGATFLVTGGASGLGRGTAIRLLDQGANVVLLDRPQSEGAAVAQQLGERCLFTGADVTSGSMVGAAIQAGKDRFGALHGLISCAGIGVASAVLGSRGPASLEEFNRVVQINLVGAFNCVRLAAQAMQANPPNPEGERGVIVLTASAAAFDGQVGQAAYAASKAGLVGMTLPLARELAKLGIRVVTLAPGLFDTPMLGLLTDEVRASLAEQVPFPHRFGKPEEFATLVQQVIENPMLNGETIRLDGALRMGAR